MKPILSISKRYILFAFTLFFLLSCANDDNAYLNKQEENDLHKTELKLKKIIHEQLIPNTTGQGEKLQTSISTLAYGSNGYLEKITKTHDYMSDIEYGYYSYNGKNLISRSFYMTDFLFFKEDFFYEEDLISKSISVYPKIEDLTTVFYKYNKDKDLIAIEIYKGDESTPDEIATFHYNSTKTIITKKRTFKDGYKETLTFWLDHKNNPSKYTLPENYLKTFVEGNQNIKRVDNWEYNHSYNKYSYPTRSINGFLTTYYEYDQP
ncbi:hypothetical protein ACKUSY_04670 [Myroides odoratus]